MKVEDDKVTLERPETITPEEWIAFWQRVLDGQLAAARDDGYQDGFEDGEVEGRDQAKD